MHLAAIMLMIVVGTQNALRARGVVFEVRTVAADGVSSPAADVLVVARSASGPVSSGLTDAKGQVSLPDVPYGRATVSFGAPSCALHSEEIVIGDSIEPVKLSVHPTAILRVQVTVPSPSGHAPVAIAGATVSVSRDHSRTAVTFITDASGSASACVDIGVEYEVRATYDGMVTSVRDDLKVVSAGTLDVPILLVPLRAEK